MVTEANRQASCEPEAIESAEYQPPSPVESRIAEQPAPPRSKLTSIQACRGVAAMLVVLFHTNICFEHPKYWNGKPFGSVFDFGGAGVEFFFVLSGFIILHVHWFDLGRPQRVRRYLWKRFRRIYPIYWFVLLPLIPGYVLVHSWGYGFERDPLVIFSSIVLVPFGGELATLAVAWTLYHEVLFYAAFAVAILNVRVGSFLLLIWLAASLLYPDHFCGCDLDRPDRAPAEPICRRVPSCHFRSSPSLPAPAPTAFP